MRTDQASITALGIALMRAIESARPADERIFCDPFARRFVPAWFYWLGQLFTKTGYAERRGPGVQGFLAARERCIDDLLLEALADGLEQLVILGAGYDARAYRFEPLKAGVRVFEVDHPASQADKRRKLAKILGEVPPHVTFASVDFNTQSLEERLLACGYDPARKTLFLWQGVTQYLQPEAVDATLGFIARRSAPGSRVVFDYIDQSVLESRRRGEVDSMQHYRGLTGEQMTFGIPDGSIVPFLEARGFAQVRDARAADLHRRYFTGKRQPRKVAAGYGIASAVVASPADEEGADS